MKHGDKAKAKSATAKASGKKTSGKEGGAKGKDAAQKVSKAIGKKEVSKAAAARPANPPGKADNGKTKTVRDNGEFSFTNPLVASAFKRAVKKYPTAFRRLTD